MKKIFAISSVLLGVVFLAGCGQQPVSKTQPDVKQATNNSAPVFKTLKEVMNTSKSYICSYNVDDQGQNISVQVTIHGVKYHSITNSDGDLLHDVYDGNNVYTWKEKAGKGFFMERACLASKGKKIEDFFIPTDEEVLNMKCVTAEKEDFSKPIGLSYFVDGCSKL